MGMESPGFLAIWAVVMAAAMLPSEWPLVRLEHATARSWTRSGILVGGYVAVWLAVGAGLMLLPFMVPLWAALAAAAVYQVTPLKTRCLTVCRAPLARILHGWRDGWLGAFRMGVENGLWCLGCCLGFVAVVVALGMTSVWWMAAMGAVVLLEKTAPWGVRFGRAATGGLAVGAVLCLL